MKQQINYDIAWQIFDEVNQNNDPDKLIDLNCLELNDAKAITKQKIYDVALLSRDGGSQIPKSHVGPFDNPNEVINKNREEQKEYVLIVQCGDDHLVQLPDNQGRPSGPVANGILEVVKNELKLDHYYISQNKIVLVKIDNTTLDNSVLNDW